MEKIGFIGLGNMGWEMATRLRGAGLSVVAHDIRREVVDSFGGDSAASPAALAEQCDVVISSLPGPPEVDEVVLGASGLREGLQPGSVYVDMSTNYPTSIRRIATELGRSGVDVVDAPVSGGRQGAKMGTLTIMVGGPRPVFDRLQPVWAVLGRDVFYTGDVGAGSVCKLVHNMVGHSVRQSLAEGFTLAVKAGVEPEALWECLRHGSTGRMSALHDTIPKKVFCGNFTAPSFTLGLGYKDIKLATDLGRELNVPLPVAGIAMDASIRAMNRGWSEEDVIASFKLQEEAACVEVRSKTAPGG